MPTYDDLKDVLNTIGSFVIETAHDFKSVWGIYPNVLIWCAIGFLLALFV